MQHRPAVPASYAVSVRQAGSLPQASFRFHLSVDTLAVLANASHYQVRSGLAPYSELTCLAHNRVGSVGLFPTLSSHTTVRAFLAYGGLLE